MQIFHMHQCYVSPSELLGAFDSKSMQLSDIIKHSCSDFSCHGNIYNYKPTDILNILLTCDGDYNNKIFCEKSTVIPHKYIQRLLAFLLWFRHILFAILTKEHGFNQDDVICDGTWVFFSKRWYYKDLTISALDNTY